MTTLCCDLVGFTSLCERIDPEDADRLLRDYYTLARGVVETYGGVIEKFAGDAVLAVFGIPSAHEDDPDRAVRAALRLVNRIGTVEVSGNGCEVRVGVNTGPALVRLDVEPTSGEGFLVGDAVNVAARLQTIAPPMGVAVGELTFELTASAFDYAELSPVLVKGKTKALRSWLARSPVARTGVDLNRRFSTPLVGREVELAVLDGLFEKAIAGSAPQFALVVGEAGIGKSRLVFELARRLDEQPGSMLTWRQGHCLAYDEGAPFWALAEIVRSHLGVDETDEPPEAEAKLERGLPPGPDQEWMAARLRPLLGLPSGPATREENFAAWRRFLEQFAQSEPCVVVIEDLHWASEGTLAFLRQLADQAAGVPLLVIATTRPELLEVQTACPLDADRWTYVNVKSLSAAETGRLVQGMLSATSVQADMLSAIAQRCGGNPFFTEELLHLLQEKQFFSLTQDGLSLSSAGSTALPASVHALIAARLDSLKPGLKRVLADASVVGQTFSPALVASLSDDAAGVAEALRDLAAREFVRPAHDSRESASEFAFRHALTREVAYEQLPRAVRARKHSAVAAWIEAHENAGGVAEALAHHYAAAFDLAQAAGETELAGDLAGPALLALRRAGDLAMLLDVAAAECHYSRAIDMVPIDGADRAHVLVAWGEALGQAGHLPDATRAIDEGIAGLRAAGEHAALAAALARLAYWRWLIDGRRSLDLTDEALSLLDPKQPSPELVMVLEARASAFTVGCEQKAAIEAADKVLETCAVLGRAPSAPALSCRAVARCELGDSGGIDDFRVALECGRQQGLGRDVGNLYGNLAAFLEVMKGPRAAGAAYEEGLKFSLRRGDESCAVYARQGLLEVAFLTGRWDEALAEAEAVDRSLSASGGRMDLQHVRSIRALLAAWRGAPGEAEPLAVWAEAASAESSPLGLRAACLMTLAVVELELGRAEAAIGHLEEAESLGRRLRGTPDYSVRLPAALRTAIGAGDSGLARRLSKGIPARRAFDAQALRTLKALLCESEGDWPAAARAYGRAAAEWCRLSVPYEQAQALLGQGRSLLAFGRADEAAAAAHAAREICARLQAGPALAEAVSLSDSISSQSGCSPAGRATGNDRRPRSSDDS